jgi:hypothetical protein
MGRSAPGTNFADKFYISKRKKKQKYFIRSKGLAFAVL